MRCRQQIHLEKTVFKINGDARTPVRKMHFETQFVFSVSQSVLLKSNGNPFDVGVWLRSYPESNGDTQRAQGSSLLQYHYAIRALDHIAFMKPIRLLYAIRA